jgi:hypothetical protein
MNVIKKLIRFPFNLLGLQIVNIHYYNSMNNKIDELIINSNKFYYGYLKMNIDQLTDSELIQYLELKYGGYSRNVNATIKATEVKKLKGISHIGGDRMSVFFKDYSQIYSEYLEPLKKRKHSVNLLEIGILKGTGLAVWDEYFENKQIYGFDYDLGNYKRNLSNLVSRGAFKKEFPTVKFFDQFSDNSNMLKEIFGNKKIDVVIDDAFHSDESIINSFTELEHYLSKTFIYIIEDNHTVWKKIESLYPIYKVEYNSKGLTIITNKYVF